MIANADTKPAAKRPRKMAREPRDEEAVHVPTTAEVEPAKRQSKADLILDMLQRPEGASIEQLVSATSWLPHTTRAVLTGLRKKGHPVFSEKLDGVRRYRIGGGTS
ncbi:uncharacterized protein DUF3489 [Novosphingobium kunmingense]|uniref:Uncharacterized protein DUF3489 n=1 Tax=Novosphingobium kunmingense TaxID=1211806 RepID=A0A2N0H5A1_9SPHN|nr:DUF3489 domain-containing protein [Novosphingobium kunmingense]PKB14102.1 uncharacterized protein DUF3489 [Novosphingobium kunmingense]